MKNNFLNISGLLALAFLLVMTSCKKEEIAPTVTVNNVNPGSAFLGDEVIITGENLHTVKAVFVGDKHAEIEAQNEGTITFTVPWNAPAGNVVLTLAMLDNYRVQDDLEVMIRPIPAIEAISPSGADIGEEVAIKGANLDNLITSKIGGVDADIVSATNTELVLKVPDGLPVNSTAEIELATEEATVTSTSIFYVGPNLIANTDFEEGSGDDFTDWEKLNGGDQMTEIADERAYFGRSMRVVGAAANPWNTQLASKPTPLTFGSEYTVIMWAKAEAEGAIMRISVSQFDGNGADYFYGDDTAIPTEWTQLSWTFEVTNDLETHKIVLDMGTTNVPFLIDNVTLIETGAAGPPVASNLLVNGGFEDGLNNWEVLNGSLETTTNAADVHCGSQALMATGAGGNPWDTQMAADHIDLVAGNEYTIALWAKSATPDVMISVSVSRWNNSDGSDYFYGDPVTLTDEWAEYTWKFTAQDPPSGVQHLVLDLGRTAAVFFIDDISVKEVTPTISLLPNGGFEDDLTSWEVLNGTFDITTDANQVASGSKALLVTGAGGNPWDTQMAADHLELVAGNQYGISLKAKAAAPDVMISVSVSRWNNSDGSDYFYGDPVTITEEWAEYSWTFTAQDPPSGMQHLVLDFGRTAAEFYVDDIVILKNRHLNAHRLIFELEEF